MVLAADQGTAAVVSHPEVRQIGEPQVRAAIVFVFNVPAELEARRQGPTRF